MISNNYFRNPVEEITECNYLQIKMKQHKFIRFLGSFRTLASLCDVRFLAYYICLIKLSI